MKESRNDRYRQLPSVDELLRHPTLAGRSTLPRAVVVASAREVIRGLRQAIDNASDGELKTKIFEPDKMAGLVLRLADLMCKPDLVPVINATGVVLHTNLGRSPLPPEAAAAVATIAGGYANLELDLATGSRSSRHDHLGGLLQLITGAEASMVVNNNAAAVLLALAALAAEREVLVSRGELVEIGGSFRIPDVLRQSGAILREVGTTNKTRISDYAKAIGENTGLLLKVHTSNYRVVGFAESTRLDELVALGAEHDLPVVEDIGSGALFDAANAGLQDEPSVKKSVEAGADLVTFSGDKLLGGPQAGIIVGKKDVVEKLKQHPLARALRVDALTIAALHGTLVYWLDEDRWKTLPTLSMLMAGKDELAGRAGKFAKVLTKGLGAAAEVDLLETASMVGGGAMPTQELPTVAIAIRSPEVSAGELARRLRTGAPPVVARVEDDALIVDLRTVPEGQVDSLAQAIISAVKSEPG